MDKKDIDAKFLVFNKYMTVNDEKFSFNPKLESLINQKNISTEDALKIILELMYDVINYNYNANDVKEEFQSLLEKVKEYNIEGNAIKNSVLFFKDYSYEKDLFIKFTSNLKIDDKYKTEIKLVLDSIKSGEVSDNSANEDNDSFEDSNNSLEDSNCSLDIDINSLGSLRVRQRMQLDKEIRMLSKTIRKKYPYNWREKLKDTDVYKKRRLFDIQEELSEEELEKLKTRLKYISNKLEYSIKSYSGVIHDTGLLIEKMPYDEELTQMLEQLTLTRKKLINTKDLFYDFDNLDRISEKIEKADRDLEIIKNKYERKLLFTLSPDFKILEDKFKLYSHLMDETKSLFEMKLSFYLNLKPKLSELINNVNNILTLEDRKALLNDLKKIFEEYKQFANQFNEIDEILNNKNFKSFNSIQQANEEIAILKSLMETIVLMPEKYFEEKIVYQEKIYKDLYENEQRKLKIRSDYLINRIKKVMENYNELINVISYDLEKFTVTGGLDQLLDELKLKREDLIENQHFCSNFSLLDDVSVKINAAEEYLENKKEVYNQLLINLQLELDMLDEKYEEYSNLILEVKSLIEIKTLFFSEWDLKLTSLTENTANLSDSSDKKVLSSNLEKIRREFNRSSFDIDEIQNSVENKNISSFNSVNEANTEISMLNFFIDKLKLMSTKYFEEKIIEYEKIYQELLSLNNKINSEGTEKLLKECEKYFKRPMFMRQLKKFNLNDDELEKVKKDIESDIVNYVITDDGNLKGIIKTRCRDFRKNNSRMDEQEIDNILKDFTFSEISRDVVEECKDMVKIDFIEGNITINQVELKLNNYINKKLRESDQLEELERIKNNPRVPSIKLHLTQEENEEIYIITKQEIISEYGIEGNVENRVYFWMNKKIRENQSEARGRLNSIKREFSTLTKLDIEQQNEFIHQIEFNINDNKIKYYEITEEYIVELSEDFINYGKLEL